MYKNILFIIIIIANKSGTVFPTGKVVIWIEEIPGKRVAYIVELFSIDYRFEL